MMRQEEALAVLKTGANVFLTGEPGSGKTHTVNAYTDWLRQRGVEPAITASTGIAATHVGGMTIHAWSGIGVRRDLSAYDLDAIASNKRVHSRVSSASVLVIDEVSMLSATILSMADRVCREVRRRQEPFGGLQVILVGDFFQLPPISRAERGAESMVSHSGEGDFAFQSTAWEELNPLSCYLSEQHRQEDTRFLALLCAIRCGRFAEEHKALLRTRYAKEPKGGVTHLYSHNADVDRLNESALAALPGKAREFEMTQRGGGNLVEQLKRGCLSPEILKLKEGARVMFTKNDPAGRFANGTLGEIVGFEEGTGYPKVRTNVGRTLIVEPAEWTMQDGGKILARIAQVPLRLSWAITVHKSQGMSLDAAHMDLSGAFEYGQGYVALSRVRTLAGLSIAGLNAQATAVHPAVAVQDENFREQSERVRERFAHMPQSELALLQQRFLAAIGGREGAGRKKPKEAAKRQERGATLDTTKELLTRDLSLAEIAQERHLTQGTIVSHLEQLYLAGAIDARACSRAARGREREINLAKEAWREQGDAPLSAVFARLKGRVPYDAIRLAKILMNG